MVVKLPKLFNMDDYYECVANKSLYCKTSAKLHPNDNTSSIWEKILEMEADQNLFDRTLVHRGLCIRNSNWSHYDSISSQAERLINDRELKEYNLTSQVFKTYCTDGHPPILVADYVITIATIFLLSVIFISTMKYEQLSRNKIQFSNILIKFSLQHTFKEITKINRSEDSVKLKAIHGMRVFFMILVTVFHAKFLHAFLYYSNPEHLEEMNATSLITNSILFDTFIVQTFFLISTFLLANQLHKTVETNGQFTLRDVFAIIINRFFRLGTTVAATVLLVNSSILRRLSGIATLEVVAITEEACRKHWTSTILFYNNFHYSEDLCNGVTWSNSVDFQMYVLVTFLFYFIFKYKLHQWKTMALSLLSSIATYGIILYCCKTGIIRNTIRSFELTYVWRSVPMRITYMSTFASWSTSFLGMILGTIYFKYKHIVIKNTMLKNLGWFLTFAGLPLVAVLIAGNRYSRLELAVVGALIKPIFALGIGIGILGMSYGLGGIVKTICESKLMVIFSNFTYCIYLSNWLMTMTTHSRTVTLIEMPIVNNLIITYIVAMTKSIILGILLTVLVEQPALALQKDFLPQIKKTKLN